MEELIKRLERVIQTGAPDKDGTHPISAEVVLEVVKELSELSTNLAEVGTDAISRQSVIDAFNTNIDELVVAGKENADAVEKYLNRVIDEIKQLPPIQPSNNSENPNSSDVISRQAAIDDIWTVSPLARLDRKWVDGWLRQLPSAQPEIIRCKDCIYYDPPHVENNGVRYEYDEMPADAFDALGTGLVNAEYGINIGGRCCVDYYCKNYSDDKRVFVREDNYCGRAERRTDE